MIPVLTVSQMRAVDAEAIDGDAKKGYAYMCKAGQGLRDAVRRLAPDAGAGDVAIVCGKGNNGGDGYAAGRYLMEAGYGVMCFGMCDKEQLSGEARIAFDDYAVQNGNFLLLNDAADLGGFKGFRCIIDAVLGTGIAGAPRGLYADVIRAINASGLPVVSADTPSGLNNDTGIPSMPCVHATATVTMGFPKLGPWWHPGRETMGEIVVCNLEYPYDAVLRNASHIFLPTLDELKTLLPRRKAAGSKFDHGVTLFMCGSRGMTGSACLASMAALRTGCGMAHLASAASAVPVLAARLVEPVLHAIDETESGTPATGAFDQVLGLADNTHAVCIGPGISHEAETTHLVRMLVHKINKPVVLDADGINAFKDQADILKSRSCDLVLTPHRGEWARLFGPLPDDRLKTIKILQDAARTYCMTILLKGSPTIVADAYGRAYILPYGASALATAGSGDVLSGIITSLIAQGSKPIDAAILGAFIHGRAGELAAADLTDYSVIAGDVIGYIPRVMKILCA
jgi:NAD(P)H-hydrate epimerase